MSRLDDWDQGPQGEPPLPDWYLYAERVIKAHGFIVESVDGDDTIGVEQFSFTYQRGEGWGVTFWTGWWPFADDHELGLMETIEDAVRYAAWFLKSDYDRAVRSERAWVLEDES